MASFLFYLSLLSAVVFPCALTGAVKAVKREEETKWYTATMSLCLFVITFTVLLMLRQGLNFA